MGVKQVDTTSFLSQEFNEPVFTQLSVEEYFKKKDGRPFDRNDAYANAKDFDSDFVKYAQVANMYIPCHFWDAEGPIIFSKEDLASSEFNIEVIADISCDIAGPIPSTIRPSTVADPIYEVNRNTLQEVSISSEDSITVMAVDNLPCELPKDASEDFGGELINSVLPALLVHDPDSIIDRATITKNGDLNSHFEYLRGYLEGK